MRYKRSLLGVWWALLNPMLRVGVMWVVMAAVFRPALPGIPYVVYLLSGIAVMTFFEQAVQAAGASLVNSASVITKVYVPPLSFAISAVLAANVTLVATLIPLLIIQLATGVGIPWTVVLLPIPVTGLIGLATGVGLIVASLAVRFHDVLDLTTVILQVLAFATPTFYPIEAIPHSYRWIIELNPLTQVVMLFRAYVYQGQIGSWQTILACVGSGVGATVCGVVIFARGWRRSAVML
jgi:ABC-2 type transport system permease protein